MVAQNVSSVKVWHNAPRIWPAVLSVCPMKGGGSMYICIAAQFQNSHETAGLTLGILAYLCPIHTLMKEALCTKVMQRQKIMSTFWKMTGNQSRCLLVPFHYWKEFNLILLRDATFKVGQTGHLLLVFDCILYSAMRRRFTGQFLFFCWCFNCVTVLPEIPLNFSILMGDSSTVSWSTQIG